MLTVTLCDRALQLNNVLLYCIWYENCNLNTQNVYDLEEKKTIYAGKNIFQTCAGRKEKAKQNHQMATQQHNGRMYKHMLGTDAKGPLKRLTLIKALKKITNFPVKVHMGFYSDP